MYIAFPPLFFSVHGFTAPRVRECKNEPERARRIRFLGGHYSSILPFEQTISIPVSRKFEILDFSKFFFISNFTELVRRRYYCSVSVGERMVLIVASIVPFQRRGIRNDARPRDTIKERERESLRVVGLLTFPGARFWHRDPTFFVRPTDISLHSHAWNESRATRSPSPPRNAPPLCKARDPRAVDHVALRDSTYPHIFIVAVHHRDNDFFNNVFSFRNENGLRPRIWIANNFFTKRKQFPPGWKKFRGEREIYSGAG